MFRFILLEQIEALEQNGDYQRAYNLSSSHRLVVLFGPDYHQCRPFPAGTSDDPLTTASSQKKRVRRGSGKLKLRGVQEGTILSLAGLTRVGNSSSLSAKKTNRAEVVLPSVEFAQTSSVCQFTPTGTDIIHSVPGVSIYVGSEEFQEYQRKAGAGLNEIVTVDPLWTRDSLAGLWRVMLIVTS